MVGERDAVVQFEHVTDCVEELNGALVATNCRFRQSFVCKLDQLLSGGTKNSENRQEIIIGSLLFGLLLLLWVYLIENSGILNTVASSTELSGMRTGSSVLGIFKAGSSLKGWVDDTRTVLCNSRCMSDRACVNTC